MGIGQLLAIPSFFASNAIHPVDLMPPWLRAIASINPLTYLVGLLRGFTIVGGESVHGYALDFSVLFAVFITLLIAAVSCIRHWRSESRRAHNETYRSCFLTSRSSEDL